MKVIFVKAGGHSIIHHHAVILEHKPVTTFSDCQLQPAIGIDPVQEFSRIRPLNIDLAKGGRIQKAGSGACGQHLAIDSILHGLAGLRIVPGTHPLADMFKSGPVGAVPVIHTGQACRIEKAANVAPGDGPEICRGIGHPKGGGADIRNGVTQRIGKDGKTVDI